MAEEAGDAEWVVEEGVTLYVRVNPVLDATQPQWFGSSTSEGVLCHAAMELYGPRRSNE
jgi:hypothetical protein